jgi:hypothetical protein
MRNKLGWGHVVERSTVYDRLKYNIFTINKRIHIVYFDIVVALYATGSN